LRSIFFETPSIEKIMVGASSVLATGATETVRAPPASSGSSQTTRTQSWEEEGREDQEGIAPSLHRFPNFPAILFKPQSLRLTVPWPAPAR
jgi:hypothetical protein